MAQTYGHTHDIAFGMIEDLYGIVAVAPSKEQERIIVKDLAANAIIADVVVPFGFIETVGEAYMKWGREQL